MRARHRDQPRLVGRREPPGLGCSADQGARSTSTVWPLEITSRATGRVTSGAGGWPGDAGRRRRELAGGPGAGAGQAVVVGSGGAGPAAGLGGTDRLGHRRRLTRTRAAAPGRPGRRGRLGSSTARPGSGLRRRRLRLLGLWLGLVHRLADGRRRAAARAPDGLAATWPPRRISLGRLGGSGLGAARRPATMRNSPPSTTYAAVDSSTRTSVGLVAVADAHPTSTTWLTPCSERSTQVVALEPSSSTVSPSTVNVARGGAADDDLGLALAAR